MGHAGTLDKFAEGLLVVLVGRMTRLCPLATSMDKEYDARFVFGRGTDTLDPEGSVVGYGPVPSRHQVEDALQQFRGVTSQVPPAYSAVHVDGRRASEAARQGELVALKPRMVTISRLELAEYEPPEARLLISCSKGTYVRSLARDIAAALHTVAHVSRLRRTRIGGFTVDAAHTPENLRLDRDLLPPGEFFRAATSLGRAVVSERWAGPLSRGIRLELEMFETLPPGPGIIGAFAGEELVAVVERAGDSLTYLCTFPVSQAAGTRP